MAQAWAIYANPCKRLHVADVQSLFSARLSKLAESGLSNSAMACSFSTARDESKIETVTVLGPQAALYFDHAVAAKLTRLAGRSGERLLRESGDVWIYAFEDSAFCTVRGDARHREQLRGAERFAGKPIPDAVAFPIARKFDILCRKLMTFWLPGN